MTDDRKIRQKIEELFGDSNKSHEDMEEILFTERSELEDLSNEDVQEVAEYLKHRYSKQEEREANKPKQRWKWKFYGLWWFKIILFVFEFLILTASLYFLIPLSINTSITIIQAFSSAAFLTILRQWKK
jgi:ABC-type multidrug transport system fused ATPase/permease subunit